MPKYLFKFAREGDARIGQGAEGYVRRGIAQNRSAMAAEQKKEKQKLVFFWKNGDIWKCL